MLENLVEITEPICRMLDSKKSDYLLYNTTEVEANVKENNPKFFTSKLNSAKKSASKANHMAEPFTLTLTKTFGFIWGFLAPPTIETIFSVTEPLLNTPAISLSWILVLRIESFFLNLLPKITFFLPVFLNSLALFLLLPSTGRSLSISS